MPDEALSQAAERPILPRGLEEYKRLALESLYPPTPPEWAKLEELLSAPERHTRLQAALEVLTLTIDDHIEANMPVGLRGRWESLLARALEVRGQKQVAKNLRIGKWGRRR